MNKITPEAAERCSRKGLREQLEDCRRQMQRESGAGDMQAVDEHLNHDNWKTRIQQPMRLDGAD